MKHLFSRRQWLAAAAGSQAARGASRRRPNFVIILADDLGYGDVGVYGATGFRTPNLDGMAGEGVRFGSFYTAAPVCTPTRAALLTGCHPVRLGLGHRVLFPYSTTGLNPDEITIAEILRRQGYATACVGKWHLGHHRKFLPTRQGFDSYFGIPYSNDMGNFEYRQQNFTSPPLPLLRNEEPVVAGPDQRYLTRRYTDESVDWIRRHRERPFFLYLAHHMPHVPIAASEEFRGKSAHGLYGDVIEELDWSVGQVLGALKRLGVDGNTFVVFTSDNGAVVWEGEQRGYRSGSCGPFRGQKGTTWEGGMRVPCIARWPGKIPAGRTCDHPATVMDLLPTMARLAGTHEPRDRIIDGRDIWPLLASKPGATSPHEVIFFYRDERLEAVRSGRWKLHFAKEQAFDPPRLFDLEADRGESRDVAAEHPDVVRRLEKLAEALREDLGDASRNRTGRNVRPVGH
ncbi:MAG: sulfatase [Bryobacteraceae bacterium]